MMQLETEADGRSEVTSLDELKARLAGLDPEANSFAILFKDAETFVQTGAETDGFIIERRAGAFTRHFYAAKPGTRRTLKGESWLIPKADRGHDRFSREEMTELFAAFFGGNELGRNVSWMPMEMADPDAVGTKVLRGLRILFWTIVILAFGALILWLRLGR